MSDTICRHGYLVCGTCERERAALGWYAPEGDEDDGMEDARDLREQLDESREYSDGGVL